MQRAATVPSMQRAAADGGADAGAVAAPEDDLAIQSEIVQGQMLVLAKMNETKMAYAREEERSLISSFNKDQRKYGTTSTYFNKPERFISYTVQPGDTLQGISLKNNVTMEQLKRANKLWTNDSLHLRRTLLVPVPLEPGEAVPDVVMSASTSLDSLHSSSSTSTRTNGVQRAGSQGDLDRSEQSASEFLSNVDSVIATSKRSVEKMASSQPLTEQDEDVLYVRPCHSRLRRHLYGPADAAAVPVTTVRTWGRSQRAQQRSQSRHNDIFEL